MDKANVVPVHKKTNLVWKTIGLSLYSLFAAKLLNVISLTKCLLFLLRTICFPNQSRFRPTDSCVNQLLAITHEIYKSFDERFKVRGVFLDISKVSNNVWHEGLLLKLNQNDISGNLLKLLRHFLCYQKQQVVLNGQHSFWDNVTAGVSHGSILGPLLFLIYINDLSNNLSSNCKLFGDGKSLYSELNNIHTNATTLSRDLNAKTHWALQGNMISDPYFTKIISPYYIQNFYIRSVRLCRYHLWPRI